MSRDNYKLGISATGGLGIDEVNNMFQHATAHSTIGCIYCGNSADYKIIPKKDSLNTAQIQDKGYICERCLHLRYLDANSYGVRKL